RFKASSVFSLRMYYGDFDDNGKSETIVTKAIGDNYYPLDGLDVLASQIPSLRKKFLSYQSFAGKSIEQIFTKDQLAQAVVYEVDQLGSGYLRNAGEKGFQFVLFPDELQLSPLMALLNFDFDNDGAEELLVGGNYFGMQPYHGRYGSFYG